MFDDASSRESSNKKGVDKITRGKIAIILHKLIFKSDSENKDEEWESTWETPSSQLFMKEFRSNQLEIES